MKVFLAGAGGVIGRRLVPFLRDAGHEVAGTTRSTDRAEALQILGAEPVIVDVFDADALTRAVVAAAPQVVIHQLTDLLSPPGTAGFAESLSKNARLRIDGTRNLMDAAKAAGVKRVIAQSVAFAYAESKSPHVETDPLAPAPDGEPYSTVRGVVALEEAVTRTPRIEGVVLRYGYLYGPGTWNEGTVPPGPAIHVDAAAHAALLALSKGQPGIYNIADDGESVSSEKAKRELGFDARYRSAAKRAVS
jgi:nucleoside-diphosphate-sugar epimerase